MNVLIGLVVGSSLTRDGIRLLTCDNNKNFEYAGTMSKLLLFIKRNKINLNFCADNCRKSFYLKNMLNVDISTFIKHFSGKNLKI